MSERPRSIDFPGGAGEDQLEHISWDEWFRKFEESNLAFPYQDEKASGEDSTFFKLSSADPGLRRTRRPPPKGLAPAALRGVS